MYEKYRSSLERHNAPYRGASRREDTVNFDLAVLHDLMHIQRVSGDNANYQGHKQNIQDNFTSLYNNEGEVTSSIPSAGFLYQKLDTIEKPIQNWTKKFNATLTKVNNKWNTYQLKSSTHQAGIVTNLKMAPGEIVSLKVNVESMTQSNLSFAIGSPYNNNLADIDIYSLKDFYKNPRYIEKRILSETYQELEIGFYGIYNQEGASTIHLQNLELSYLYQKENTIEGIDSILKQELRQLEHEVMTISKHKEKMKEVFK